MIENLTSAQQIFSVFYAIFFGIMLQTVGARRSNVSKLTREKNHDITFNLFDTPNAWAIGFRYDNKPFWRFLLSILFLNIIPGAVFAIVFIGLNQIHKQIGLTEILVILWISLIPHYLYRIYIAIVVLFKSELYLKKGEHDNYNQHDIFALALWYVDREQYSGHKSFVNHIAFPVFVVLPSVVLLYDYFLVRGQINLSYILLSRALLLLAVILFLAPRKLK